MMRNQNRKVSATSNGKKLLKLEIEIKIKALMHRKVVAATIVLRCFEPVPYISIRIMAIELIKKTARGRLSGKVFSGDTIFAT